MTREQTIIDQIRRATGGSASRDITLGIGDDTAVIRAPRQGDEILLTTDQVIENTHFERHRHPSRALGHKTLARGLSDIAAMGGAPVCFLLSLCLAGWVQGRWLKQYINGMIHLSKRLGVPCVGGDVARGEHFGADVSVVGRVPRGTALTRSGAQPGDRLYVSGSLGGSALGFTRVRSGKTKSAAARRHLFPEPRLALGDFLRRRLKVSAAMDLSDGLSMDLTRLARASGVGAEVDESLIPVFRGASIEQALHGGEEYELLFTVPPAVRVPNSAEGVSLTCIGEVRKRKTLTLRSGGRIGKLEPLGFQHFNGL